MNNTLIFNFSEIFMVICTLISMICSIIFTYRVDSPDFSYVSSLGKNWSKGPIFSAETSTNCSASQVPLIDDVWAGTRLVCSNTKSPPLSDSCGKGTKMWPIIEPKPYTYWHGAKICAKRMNFHYFDLEILKKESECRQRSCGIIDSLGNYLCVGKNTQCPYNSLEVVQNNTKVPTDYSYTKIPLKDADMLFAYRENYQKSILNQFLIEEQSPCANPYFKNYKSKIYFAEKLFYRDQCYKGYKGIDNIIYDPRAEEKDSYGFWNVYHENGIHDALNVYPSYKEFEINELSSRTLKLFHKWYVGVDAVCIQKIKIKNIGSSIIKDLIEIETNLNQWHYLPYFAMSFSIFSLIVVILFTFIFSYSFYCSDRVSEHNIYIFRSTIFCFPGLINLSVLIMYLIIKSESKSGLSFAFLVEQKCLDSLSIQGINIAIDSYHSFITLLKFIICSNAFYFFPLMINFYLANNPKH